MSPLRYMLNIRLGPSKISQFGSVLTLQDVLHLTVESPQTGYSHYPITASRFSLKWLCAWGCAQGKNLVELHTITSYDIVYVGYLVLSCCAGQCSAAQSSVWIVYCNTALLLVMYCPIAAVLITLQIQRLSLTPPNRYSTGGHCESPGVVDAHHVCQQCGTLVMSSGSWCSRPPRRVKPHGAPPERNPSTSLQPPSSLALGFSSPGRACSERRSST